MTDREALVERVAEALYGVLHGRFIPTFYEGEEALLLAARAALAVIEAERPVPQSVAEARANLDVAQDHCDTTEGAVCAERERTAALVEAVRGASSVLIGLGAQSSPRRVIDWAIEASEAIEAALRAYEEGVTSGVRGVDA